MDPPPAENLLRLNMSCVYVLQSHKDGKLYVGSTRGSALDRLNKHNRGSVRSTKGRRPFGLIYSESFPNYQQARQKEFFYKSGVGKQELKKLLDEIRAGTRVDKGGRL